MNLSLAIGDSLGNWEILKSLRNSKGDNKELRKKSWFISERWVNYGNLDGLLID